MATPGRNAYWRQAVVSARLFFLVAVLAGGCADIQAIFSPPPATKAPPTRKEPPPRVLTPGVGREEEDRLRQETTGKIQRVEQTVRQIDQQKLAKSQQETYSSIQDFLAGAKEALSTRDLMRAANLADKAQVLSEELMRSLR